MAVAPVPPVVSAGEYLRTAFRPDREYVEGFLMERGMPTIAHSLLQAILIAYFRLYAKSFRFVALPEARMQIVDRSRYRVPDIILCPAPLPPGKVVTSVPWAVIEIMSPDDRMPDELDRFRDYKQIGVQNVILLDPEGSTAFRFEEGSLLRTQFTLLELPTGSLPFDTEAIFQQLREELGQ
jgi:Uma2 family endonuclease